MPERPHIVILAKCGSQWVGGQQYWRNLTSALIAAKQTGIDVDVSVLVDQESQLTVFDALRPSLRYCDEMEAFQKPFTLYNRVRWRWAQMGMRSLNARLEEALLDIGATFVYPLRSRKVSSADWIPDFQYHHYPEGSNPAEVAERKRDAAAAISMARGIVLSSSAAERDCHALFPSSRGLTSVLRFRVFVDPMLLMIDPHKTVLRYNLPSRYVLVSNLLAPTKNHKLVLEALAAIPPSERRDIHVVCTGDLYDYRNPGFYNQFLALVHELGVRDNVSFLGLIPKPDQMHLLRASLASLQPSLFEGWHTGVEEAHLLGKRIVLSDIPVHREQSPPRADYFDPRDPNALAERLRLVFSEETNGGFDQGAERNAVQAYGELQRQYAQDFLAIASRA